MWTESGSPVWTYYKCPSVIDGHRDTAYRPVGMKRFRGLPHDCKRTNKRDKFTRTDGSALKPFFDLTAKPPALVVLSYRGRFFGKWPPYFHNISPTYNINGITVSLDVDDIGRSHHPPLENLDTMSSAYCAFLLMFTWFWYEWFISLLDSSKSCVTNQANQRFHPLDSIHKEDTSSSLATIAPVIASSRLHSEHRPVLCFVMNQIPSPSIDVHWLDRLNKL